MSLATYICSLPILGLAEVMYGSCVFQGTSYEVVKLVPPVFTVAGCTPGSVRTSSQMTPNAKVGMKVYVSFTCSCTFL